MLKNIKIVSIHFNNTEYIEWQYKSIKKFVKDKKYEYIVFSDAINMEIDENFKNKNINNDIFNKCRELDIKCVRIPQIIHEDRSIIFPNVSKKYRFLNDITCRCVNSLQWVLENYIIGSNDIVIVMDSDMFLIDYINFNNLMNNNHIICRIGGKIVDGYNGINLKGKNILPYFFNLFIIDTENCPNIDKINLDAGSILYKNKEIELDAGGHTYNFIENNKDKLNISDIGYTNFHKGRSEENFINKLDLNIYTKRALLEEKKIMNYIKSEIAGINKQGKGRGFIYHYGAGSNWEKKSIDYHKKRRDIVRKMLNNLINN